MGLFRKDATGVCPECHSVIEDLNDKYCANCGWKISKFRAVLTQGKVKSETTKKKYEAKQKEHEIKAQGHKEDFKVALNELADTTNDIKHSLTGLKSSKSNGKNDNEIKIVVKPKIISDDNYDDLDEWRREQEEKDRILHIWVENNHKSQDLEANGDIDGAIKCLEENVKLNADTPFTYSSLANLYHYKKEFLNERDILKTYIDLLNENPLVRDDYKIDFIKRVENVESYLNTGRWKFDCLPSDPKIIYYDIKEAKTLLNSDERQKGIDMLEEIMDKGSYNNTVYNTLYQIYKKDKQFDDAIRVCNKAIEVLGLFSNDRKSRWTINLEKVTKQKEKASKKQ